MLIAVLSVQFKRHGITSMVKRKADETFDLNGVHEAVTVNVEDIIDGSDEVLVVMETIVPGVGKHFPLDSEPHSDVQQLLITHIGQQMSQAAHCKVTRRLHTLTHTLSLSLSRSGH